MDWLSGYSINDAQLRGKLLLTVEKFHSSKPRVIYTIHCTYQNTFMLFTDFTYR